MSRAAWVVCALVLGLALAVSLGLGARARRAGRWEGRAALRAPATWLFVAYLVAAGLLVPTSEGETTSPLIGLAGAVTLLVLLAGVAARGAPRSPWARAGLGALFALATLCAGAVVLALASPRWVPAWLR